MKVNWTKVKKFVKENGVFMAQLSFMGYIALSGDIGFAATSGSGEAFSKITGPLTKVQETMTGPIARTVGTIGIGAAALATGLNMENQVLKRSIQLTGGVAGAIGASSLIQDIGGTSSGLLF